MEIAALENEFTELEKIKNKAVKERNYELAASSRDKLKVLIELIRQKKVMKEDVYVYGIANSSMNFDTASSRRKLELDVLQLIHFVNLFANKEIKVFAVMLVYNEEIKRLICEKWFQKYYFEHGDYFKVITFERNEFFLNRNSDIVDDGINNNPIADEKVAIEILRDEIERYFNGNLHQVENELLDVNWDYKGLYKI